VLRPYQAGDREAVRTLFIAVNRELAPPELGAAFEAYIERAIGGEIDRIPDCYAPPNGTFWVAVEDKVLAGMFGLQDLAGETARLRCMYVARSARRRGIAGRMLAQAEQLCRAAGCRALSLTTLDLQRAAIAFYAKAGYRPAGANPR
jgi:GNAT superfamily N-acetyltransferase